MGFALSAQDVTDVLESTNFTDMSYTSAKSYSPKNSVGATYEAQANSNKGFQIRSSKAGTGISVTTAPDNYVVKEIQVSFSTTGGSGTSKLSLYSGDKVINRKSPSGTQTIIDVTKGGSYTFANVNEPYFALVPNNDIYFIITEIRVVWTLEGGSEVPEEPVMPDVKFEDVELEVGQTHSIENDWLSKLDFTYTIGGESPNAISIANGVISANEVGNATVTASWDAVDGKYLAGSTEFNVTVKAETPADVYTLVTSKDEIYAGGKYILVGNNSGTFYGMGGMGTGSYRDIVSVAVENENTIKLKSDSSVDPFTLEANGSGYKLRFADENGVAKYAEVAASNNLNLGGNGTIWTVDLKEDYTVAISAKDTKADIRYIQFNYPNTRVAGYKNTQDNGYLFRLNDGTVIKQDVSLSFEMDEYAATVGGEFVAPELNGLPEGLAEYVSYTSTDEAVATVANDGSVTIKGAGTTTITANLAETDNYEAASATYTLIVTDPTVLGPITVNGQEVKNDDVITVFVGTTVSIEAENSEMLTIDALDAAGDKVLDEALEADSYEWTGFKRGTYTFNVASDEQTVSFTIIAKVDAPELGATYVNNKEVANDEVVDVYVNSTVTFEVKNAECFDYTITPPVGEEESDLVNGATFSYEPKQIGQYIVLLTAEGFNGEESNTLFYLNVTEKPEMIEGTVTFDFVNNDYHMVRHGSTSQTYNEGAQTVVSNCISLTLEADTEKGKHRLFDDGWRIFRGSKEGKVYLPENYTMTISATSGTIVKKVTISGGVVAKSTTVTYNESNITSSNSSYTIEANAQEVAIHFATTANVGISTVDVEYEGIATPVIASYEGLTPSADNFVLAAKGEDGSFTYKVEHDFYGAVIYHKYISDAPAQVNGRRITSHEGYNKAVISKNGDTVEHSITVAGPGRVEYYGYHPGDDAVGEVTSFIINDDGTTSIESIMLDGVDPEACYDLQGRRVVRPVRGLFISNGRKVYVK